MYNLIQFFSSLAASSLALKRICERRAVSVFGKQAYTSRTTVRLCLTVYALSKKKRGKTEKIYDHYYGVFLIYLTLVVCHLPCLLYFTDDVY